MAATSGASPDATSRAGETSSRYSQKNAAVRGKSEARAVARDDGDRFARARHRERGDGGLEHGEGRTHVVAAHEPSRSQTAEHGIGTSGPERAQLETLGARTGRFRDATPVDEALDIAAGARATKQATERGHTQRRQLPLTDERDARDARAVESDANDRFAARVEPEEVARARNHDTALGA